MCTFADVLYFKLHWFLLEGICLSFNVRNTFLKTFCPQMMDRFAFLQHKERHQLIKHVFFVNVLNAKYFD